MLVLALTTPAAAADTLWIQMSNQCPKLETLCTRPSPEPTASRSPRPSPSPTPAPFPTQTQRPGSTPVPIPSIPPFIDDTCADGYLDRVVSSGSEGDFYGVTNVRIVAGARKRYCARVMPPILPSTDVVPRELIFEWTDLSGRGCGAINMLVESVSEPPRARGNAGFVSDGNIQFVRTDASPGATAQGVYSITVSGGAETCVLYKIGWRWVP